MVSCKALSSHPLKITLYNEIKIVKVYFTVKVIALLSELKIRVSQGRTKFRFYLPLELILQLAG